MHFGVPQALMHDLVDFCQCILKVFGPGSGNNDKYILNHGLNSRFYGISNANSVLLLLQSLRMLAALVQRSQYVTGCASTIWRFHRVPSPPMYPSQKVRQVHMSPHAYRMRNFNLSNCPCNLYISTEILLLFIFPPQNSTETLPTAHPTTVPPPPLAS